VVRFVTLVVILVVLFRVFVTVEIAGVSIRLTSLMGTPPLRMRLLLIFVRGAVWRRLVDCDWLCDH
jgi:uncharacterized integral membrane protein